MCGREAEDRSTMLSAGRWGTVQLAHGVDCRADERLVERDGGRSARQLPLQADAGVSGIVKKSHNAE